MQITNGLHEILNTPNYKLRLLNAEYHKRESRLAVCVMSDTILKPEHESSLRRDFERLLPQGGVLTLSIEYDNINERLKKDFEVVQRELKEAMRCKFSELAPFISMSVWTFENDCITIKLPGAYSDFLHSPVDFIRREYKLSIPVNIVTDDTIEFDITRNDKVISMSVPRNNNLAKEQKHTNVTEAASKKKKNTASALPLSAPSLGKSNTQSNVFRLLWGKMIPETERLTPLKEVRSEIKSVTVRGRLLPLTEEDEKRSNTDWLRRTIADDESAITFSMNTKKPEKKTVHDAVKSAEREGLDLIVRGKSAYNDYTREWSIIPYDICAALPSYRKDTSEHKRVELHLHTQFSEMDGLLPPSEAIKMAARWGHKAVAITDHGVAHAFPEAMLTAKKEGIKLIYGVEGYLYDDCVLADPKEYDGKGLVALSASVSYIAGEGNIFELSAFKPQTGEKFHTFVNPGIAPGKDLSHTITPADLQNAPSVSTALRELAEFIGEALAITHNSEYYLTLCAKADQMSVKLNRHHIDTCRLAHYVYPDIKDDDLLNIERVAKEIRINTELLKHECEIVAEIYKRLQDDLVSRGASLPIMKGETKHKRGKRVSYYHILLLAKNTIGLKNMYKLITHSHLESFHGRPLMPRSLFSLCRDGLILGSACERGELFRAVLSGKTEDELKAIASWYDFLEIQPVGNNAFMIRNGTAANEEYLRDINRRIVALGEALFIPVAATGDVHFLNPADSVYRAVIMHTMHFKDAEEQAPLYFKTTDEMLEEFSYLGKEKAFEVVVTVPNNIANDCSISSIYPEEKETYVPVFEGAEKELTDMANEAAQRLYGNELPALVRERLDFELNSIIGNGYATLFLMAQRLVVKSMSDGYLVGSRGSVGSSFVAYLVGITEINPLPAHYLCPDCKSVEFVNSVDCGVDLKRKKCPHCGADYTRTGYGILFEVFLGFKGDKTPDIDLNFSGDYQWRAHNFVREMVGEKRALRAGVISTLKEKTAFGYAKKFNSENGLNLTNSEITRLAMGCVGVKKTTGQHAGGIVIVPEGFESADFMPLQYPANKKEGNYPITHFDFHALHDKLVKLDILGHDDPTALKMLEDMTGILPQSVPMDDEETMALFSGQESLKTTLPAIDCDNGALGLPEYGTGFVRRILSETRPKTIEELISICGLSHGTDVWTGNAQALINDGQATLAQTICARDDIMNFLIHSGCEPMMAFKIMESVRRGKGLTPEMESAMIPLELPKWYMQSCKKIKYLFPRAHAAAYLMMSFRVAYYKMHHPKEFYAVYFTVRADDFDIELCSGGTEQVARQIKNIKTKLNADNGSEDFESADEAGVYIPTSAKLKKLLSILEVVYEMNMRGIQLLNVDINRSNATQFKVVGNSLVPPFNAIPGLGNNLAFQIYEAQQKLGREFSSVEEFRTLTGVGIRLIDRLDTLGCFEGMARSDQLNLFDVLT